VYIAAYLLFNKVKLKTKKMNMIKTYNNFRVETFVGIRRISEVNRGQVNWKEKMLSEIPEEIKRGRWEYDIIFDKPTDYYLHSDYKGDYEKWIEVPTE
jgi:hypothetical protein